MVRPSGSPSRTVSSPRSPTDLFLLLLLSAEGNLGQARFQAAKAADKLAEVAGWLT
jgi:hypothetical protein